MGISFKNTKVIDVQDWDALVQETYGKPYSFQQQDGCKDRGHECIDVPEEYIEDPCEDNNVSFKEWLETTPNLTGDKSKDFSEELKWRRDFYPHVSMIINDLHSKGLLDVGQYEIDIDW
jgi:hypothetical protein